MKKLEYNRSGNHVLTDFEIGETFLHVDTLDKSRKSDFVAEIISDSQFKIIEPSERQREESETFWTDHVVNVDTLWFTVRGAAIKQKSSETLEVQE